MTAGRDSWIKKLRVLMGGRPVRWAEPSCSIGDYDGRDRAIEVFNADVKDQRALLRQLRPDRADLEGVAGGPVIVIFHTTSESGRLYAEFVQAALHEEAAEDVAIPEYELSDIEALAQALDVALQERQDDKPGSGSTALPRVAA
ncbi:MAG TPA: hypothetical protein VJN18_22260 [Polyangiaceae bacterium]|nr:hypothetical protein [Polyangiaceae bacterium]